MTELISQHSSNPLESMMVQDRIPSRGQKRVSRATAPSSDPLSKPVKRSRHILRLETNIRIHGNINEGGDGSEDELRLKETVCLDVDEDEDMDAEKDDQCQGEEIDGDGDDNGGDDDEYDSSDQIHSSDLDDEERSIFARPKEERDEICSEIEELLHTIPSLERDYLLLDRLGTGTFSSVYKAIDLNYFERDNSPWHGFHPPTSSAYYQSKPRNFGSKVFVAIKRIYVTSSPERIRNEIAILDDCRGCRHVSQLITAFRVMDQVVAVIPYQRNDDFREYYTDISMGGIKMYFRCLFRALRDVHARKIIHRDVKPANFLFDPRTGIGTLCDFGLAARMEPGPSHNQCLHTPPSDEFPHGKNKLPKYYDVERAKRMQEEAKLKVKLERVGYHSDRPHSKANRAGTRGFRAPEVLLKCGDQSGAVDVWAAGVILLCFLLKKFPLFPSNDDTEALMEQATIFGKKVMRITALLHSRTFSTNVPDVPEQRTSWSEFVLRQNPDLYKPTAPDVRFYPHSEILLQVVDNLPADVSPSEPPLLPSPEPPTLEEHTKDVDLALDLLEKCLEPSSIQRITPRDALYHEFLYDSPDDDFFPHPFGSGVCRKFHFRDPVTDQPLVQNKDGETHTLMSGQGIAIGQMPCEYHKDMF